MARRHTPEQIIRKLREAERLAGGGATTAEAAKQLEVSEQTLHRWRHEYGGMKANGAKHLKEPTKEHFRLKRIVANRTQSRSDARGCPGKHLNPARRCAAVDMLQDRLGMLERRACRAVRQARSFQRYRPAVPDPDSDSRAWLREFSVKLHTGATGVRTSKRPEPGMRASSIGFAVCGARRACACPQAPDASPVG